MNYKITGIVLKQRNLGENDRVITILSKEMGIIEAIAKGIKSTKSKLGGSCQLFCYSHFDLYKKKENFTVTSAQVINAFYDLRLDVTKLALAGYFSEITCQISPGNETTEDFLSLLLNSIHLLEIDKKPIPLIKSIFELRSISIAGFMPNLICCKVCNTYQTDKMFFLTFTGEIICDNCNFSNNFNNDFEVLNSKNYKKDMEIIEISITVLTAMRHIIFSPSKKIYSFSIPDEELIQLNFITQKYLLLNAQGRFPSLDVYNSLIKGVFKDDN